MFGSMDNESSSSMDLSPDYSSDGSKSDLELLSPSPASIWLFSWSEIIIDSLIKGLGLSLTTLSRGLTFFVALSIIKISSLRMVCFDNSDYSWFENEDWLDDLLSTYPSMSASFTNISWYYSVLRSIITMFSYIYD